jgi:hypothetical protein
MANAFIKPNAIVDTVLGMLQSELVLPQLVWKDGLGDFAGKYNDTITIRIPQPTSAHSRVLRGTGSARNLTVSDLTETSVDVKLTDDVYNLVVLTDEEKTLDVFDFAGQVLTRQVDAVARKLEQGLADTITGAPYATTHGAAADGVYDAVVKARRQLNDAYVPRQGRYLIVGSAVEEALLLDDRFARFDSAGDSNSSALREARIGRIAGYEVIVVDAIPHGAAYLYHPTAFVMVTRPPSAPMSGADRVAAVGSANGIALRWLGDYDPSVTSDRSLVDTFVGYKAIVDTDPGFVRAARIQLLATSLDFQGLGAVTAGAGADHTRQLKLVDNNGDDRTEEAVWASSVPAKATVSNTAGTKGLVTGVAAGATNITAVVDGQTETWALTVA